MGKKISGKIAQEKWEPGMLVLAKGYGCTLIKACQFKEKPAWECEYLGYPDGNKVHRCFTKNLMALHVDDKVNDIPKEEPFHRDGIQEAKRIIRQRGADPWSCLPGRTPTATVLNLSGVERNIGGNAPQNGCSSSNGVGQVGDANDGQEDDDEDEEDVEEDKSNEGDNGGPNSSNGTNYRRQGKNEDHGNVSNKDVAKVKKSEGKIGTFSQNNSNGDQANTSASGGNTDKKRSVAEIVAGNRSTEGIQRRRQHPRGEEIEDEPETQRRRIDEPQGGFWSTYCAPIVARIWPF